MLGGWGQEDRFRGPGSFGWVWELEYTGADVVSGRSLPVSYTHLTLPTTPYV